MSKWAYPELLPPEGNAEVGSRVFELLGKIVADKINLGLHKKWLNNYKLGRNKHWNRESTTVPLITGNLLNVHRQRTVNMLTDNNPIFNVVQLGGKPDQPIYEKLHQASMCWWIEQEQQDRYEESVLNGETYGVCIEKSIFNPELEYNLGEVETVIVDPFRFGFWPLKCRDIQKAEAVFHYYPMGVAEAKRRWPNLSNLIKPDSQWLSEMGEERRELVTGNNKDSITATIAGTIKTLFTGGTEKSYDADDTLVAECWAKDYTRDPESKAYIYTGKIRCVTVCNGGKLVLSDRPNPSINPKYDIKKAQNSYLYDKFPFIMVNSAKDTSTAWGSCDFEQLEQLNREFNKSVSQMVFLKDKAARPKIVNPKSSGIPNSHFTNIPSVVNPKNAVEAAALRYMDFPNMPVDVKESVALLKEIFFLISGSFDLEQAQTPGREVIAYKAIAALLEKAATMMRGKIRNYSRLLRERGRMYLSHLQNWYTEDRWFYYEEAGESKTDKINAEEVNFPVKLTVVIGSMLPVSKVQQREEALVLFEKQAIDQQDLLEKLDWSNRSKLLERMKAGPLGELVMKLEAMGAPDEVLELINMIAPMEEEDFEKAVEGGDLPPIDWPNVQDKESRVAIENDLAMEKLKKERADRQLVEEKITTERVEQTIKQAGAEFDKEKLRIEEKKVDAEIEAIKKAPLTQTSKEKNVTEKGLKSNNEKNLQ